MAHLDKLLASAKDATERAIIAAELSSPLPKVGNCHVEAHECDWIDNRKSQLRKNYVPDKSLHWTNYPINDPHKPVKVRFVDITTLLPECARFVPSPTKGLSPEDEKEIDGVLWPMVDKLFSTGCEVAVHFHDSEKEGGEKVRQTCLIMPINKLVKDQRGKIHPERDTKGTALFTNYITGRKLANVDEVREGFNEGEPLPKLGFFAVPAHQIDKITSDMPLKDVDNLHWVEDCHKQPNSPVICRLICMADITEKKYSAREVQQICKELRQQGCNAITYLHHSTSKGRQLEDEVCLGVPSLKLVRDGQDQVVMEPDNDSVLKFIAYIVKHKFATAKEVMLELNPPYMPGNRVWKRLDKLANAEGIGRG